MIILLSTSHHFMIVLGATGYLHSRHYTAAVASRALGWGGGGRADPGGIASLCTGGAPTTFAEVLRCRVGQTLASLVHERHDGHVAAGA